MKIVEELKKTETDLESQLASVRKAITALSTNGRATHAKNGVAIPRVRKRKLSAAGRARIVAALKARWAKAKAAKKKK